jgi:hypothetical protein
MMVVEPLHRSPAYFVYPEDTSRHFLIVELIRPG